MSKQVLAIIV